MAEARGLSTQIVTTLMKYGTVPVDFLARSLGRHASEIMKDIESLEHDGVLKRDGERVALSEKST